jgi:uncharacterized membrane protein
MNPKSTASIGGHPIHPMLIPFPIAFFVGTLAVDIAYSLTRQEFWAMAGHWLLAAGLMMAALAALAGLTDFLSERQIRDLPAAWYHMGGNVVLVIIEACNLWRRLVDGTNFIVPTGLILSVLATLLLLFNGWKGWELVYRHRVGIAGPSGEPRA